MQPAGARIQLPDHQISAGRCSPVGATEPRTALVRVPRIVDLLVLTFGLRAAGGFAQPAGLVAGRQRLVLLVKRDGLGVECCQPCLGRALADCLIGTSLRGVVCCQALTLGFLGAARLRLTLAIGILTLAFSALLGLSALASNLSVALLEPSIRLFGLLLRFVSQFLRLLTLLQGRAPSERPRAALDR